MADWQDSLFDEDKGDSLGDGTWGRRTTDEPALAPVDWAAIEGKAQAQAKKQPVRTRLATPAPGSQKGSGLLDIRALAAEMKREQAEPAAPPKKHSTGEVKAAARLATAAKASTAGSGLINVADLVRQQEEEAAAAKSSTSASASSSGEARIDEPEIPAAASSSFAGTSIEAPMAAQSVAAEVVASAGHSPMLMVVLAVLTIAVVGLAIYVLTT